MEILTEIFSFFCGRGRCFVIDGQALPICQRCLGLFCGAFITGMWLWMSGLWRRGLPCRNLALIQIAIILIAMIGGLDWIDPGPRWRMLCGVCTGHITVYWLITGAVSLISRCKNHALPQWRKIDVGQGLMMVIVSTLPVITINKLLWLGEQIWSGIALMGILVILFSIALTVFALVYRIAGMGLSRGPYKPINQSDE